MRDDGCPPAGDAAPRQFDQYRRGRGACFESPEEAAIVDFDIRNRPDVGRIDQRATGIEHIDAGDIGMGSDLLPQHLVPFQGSQLSSEYFGCHSVGMDLPGNVLQNDGEIFELLIEVTGQQQHRVFQFAFVAAQGPFAKVVDHDRGTDRDGRDQECAAADKPPDRAAGQKCFHIERGGGFCRHGSRSLPGLTPKHFHAPAQYSDTSPVWR